MPGRDDPLTWDGDEDPTLVVGDAVEPDAETATENDAEIAGDTARPVPVTQPAPRTDAAPAPAPAEGSAAVAEPSTDSGLPDGWTAVGNAGTAVAVGEEASVSTLDDEPAATSAPLGNAALVTLGVLGGIYLLYSIGWLIGGLRLQGRYQVLVTDAMFQGALWLATAAPLIWFATTIFATRRTRPWVRGAWLAAGVVLLIPWIFVMIGAVGR